MGWWTLMKDYFQFLGKRMAPTKDTATNKTTMLTAATEHWTLSFCIVLYLLKLFDSLVLEDCSELVKVGDAAWKKPLCNCTWM